MQKDLKELMVRELRQYWINKKKVDKLSKNTATRTFLFYQERLEFIENTIKQLNDYELKIFNYIFKEGCNARYCEMNYNISKSTYYNIYNKAINLLAKEWGIL